MPARGLLLAVALAAGASAPPVKAVAKSLLLLSAVLPSPVKPLDVAPAPRYSQVNLKDGVADLYRGVNARMPGVVLVHGVAPGGPADPRMRQMAAALNRLGRTVLAPSLALGRQQLDVADTARIRQAIEYLSNKTGGKVTVLSFSFGAAFTLVALEQDPSVQSRVLELTTVGTYFDLVHLLQGVTAGRVDAPAGGTDPWRPDPRAGRAVTEFLARYLTQPQGLSLLDAYDKRDPSGLDPSAQSIYNLMVNKDPSRTRDLVGALPEDLANLISQLSPASRIDRIRIPVRAMHSRQDPASPPTESQLLIRSLRPPATGRLTKIGSFRHVTPSTGPGLLKDAGPLVGFAARFIRSQERWGLYR